MSKTHFTFFNEHTSYADHLVYIGEVHLGMVVQKADKSTNPPSLTNTYGHVVGFGRPLGVDDIILTVLWDDGTSTQIHPANVKIFVPSR